MKLRWGITPKLTLVFVLFAAGVLSIVNILVYSSGRTALRNATISRLLSEAIEKQAALETWVEEKQRDIIVLAANPSLTNHLASHLSASDTAELLAENDTELEYLEKWTGEGEDFLSLIVLAPNSGQVIMATNPGDLGKFRENLLYFTAGRQGPYVEGFFYSLDQGRVAMVAAAPVNTSDGKLVGVIAGYLNLNKANEIIQRRTGVNQTDDAFLVNTSNLFVTQPRYLSDPAVLQRSIHTEAVNRCLEHNNGVAYALDYRNVPAIVVYRWLPERQLCLIVKIDQAEAYAPVNTLGRNILTISILALALASALAYGLARTITRPVLGMQAAAARFAGGELNVRLPETSEDELGQLGIAFNKMAGERKRAEEALQQRTAQLEATNKELEAFTYSVSHDLRAPLRGIDGWSLALLEDEYDQLDEQGRQYLDRVRSEALHMGRLIDDLLQLSHVDRAEMQTSAVDLSALAQTVVARLQATQPERQVKVIIQPGLTAQGDAALLAIVLTNLLDNAWKFTGRRRQARIEFGYLPHPSLPSPIGKGEGGEDPVYFVKDNGVGFDMAFTQKLFGVFHRMHKTSEFPGLGIGLATVQRIVHRHGGRVWAEACVNTGATFFFTLEEAV